MTALGTRQVLFAALAGLLAGLLLVCLVSAEPLRAWLILLTGALPELRHDALQGWHWQRLIRFGTLLEDTATLTFLGLAVVLPFRARQYTLGADGQLFLGALAAAAVSLTVAGPAWLLLPLALLAAMLAGAAWGMVPGLIKLRSGANELVVSLMLNVIAIEAYRLAVGTWLRDPAAGFQATPMLPAAATPSVLLAHTGVTVFVLAVPLAAWLVAALLERTTFGYQIRVVGEAPAMARRAGLPVGRAMVLSMALGGACAGLAGFHVGNALLRRLPVDLPPGLGYEGLLVALLARHDPRLVPWAALFYAWLRTGAQAMERSTDVPREAALVIQAVVILLVVAQRWPRWWKGAA